MEIEIIREGAEEVNELENMACCMPGAFSNRIP